MQEELAAYGVGWRETLLERLILDVCNGMHVRNPDEGVAGLEFWERFWLKICICESSVSR